MNLECAKCGETAVVLLPAWTSALKNPDNLLTRLLGVLSAVSIKPRSGQWATVCKKCGNRGLMIIN